MSGDIDRTSKDNRDGQRSVGGGLTKWDYIFGLTVTIFGSVGAGLLWNALGFHEMKFGMAAGITAIVLMHGRPHLRRSFRYWALRTIVFAIAIVSGHLVQGGVTIWLETTASDMPSWLAGFPGTLMGIWIVAAILLTTTERISRRNTIRMLLTWAPVVAVVWTIINYTSQALFG
ncbi:MAG: hypothetical protein J0I17_03370 ['Candidatus Kapabacteria' thiocyanatum]|uniref:Uncharacterized protein n=1 Tax=Candidatus Kapaibacterium thiocyanatum TaxID=1895771 RepID=A0A1M3KXU1_9BACT|nr:hypothetical protein ['Candidatus Kapabacteria' thiocyanatum]OJX57193.1 MAG: hypothetical protein BGO89_11905 ['Candidatus Kapabacteria' thiocyanatum]